MRKPTGDTVLTNFELNRKTSDIIDKYCELSSRIKGKRTSKREVINEMVENSIQMIAKRIEKIESFVS